MLYRKNEFVIEITSFEFHILLESLLRLRNKLIEEGRYTEIMKWLEDHVHKYADYYEADEVMKLATGESFNDEYYFAYLESKYGLKGETK